MFGFLYYYPNITNCDSDFAFWVLPLQNSLSHRQSINSVYCNCVKTALQKSVYSYLSIDPETKQGLKNKNNCQSLNASLLILLIHRVRSRDIGNHFKYDTCKFLSGRNTWNGSVNFYSHNLNALWDFISLYMVLFNEILRDLSHESVALIVL